MVVHYGNEELPVECLAGCGAYKCSRTQAVFQALKHFFIVERLACSYNNDSSVSYQFRRQHQICPVSASDPTTGLRVWALRLWPAYVK